MKFWAFLAFVSSLAIGASAEAAAPRAYTLEKCFRLALARSDSVQITVEQINQAEAQITEARAGFFPVLSGVGSASAQQTPSSALGQNLFPSNQSTASVNLKQNLFNGFKDLATLRSKKNTHDADQFARDQAVVQLYKDTAQAFFNVLILQEDLRDYAQQIESAGQRREELGSQKKYGRAREADIVSVESNIATLEANISSTRTNLVSYEEALTFLTGLPPEASLRYERTLPKEAESMEYWLANLEERPDVQQAKLLVSAAENGTKAARAGYLPTLDLSANYYLYRPPGVYQDVRWDTSLSLSVPIFSGDSTKAQVEENNSIQRSKENSSHLAEEQGRQAIRAAYRTYLADTEQLGRYRRAKDLALRSYELMHQDALKGIATNADTLTALTTSQEASRSADRQKFKLYYDYVLLEAESARATILKEKP